MSLSLQTVSLVSGVTAVHLIVIAAFSPVEDEWTGPLPRIEIDSALEPFVGEPFPELTGGAEDRDFRAHPLPSLATAPAEESSPVEMTELRSELPREKKADDMAGTLHVQTLAEIERAKVEKVGSDVAAASRQTTRQVREIRSLQPIPRS